ncbi:Uncharacterised protein [uncultured archaeon]|nr:Uncharacterised protein [uncultured archaeon]
MKEAVYVLERVDKEFLDKYLKGCKQLIEERNFILYQKGEAVITYIKMGRRIILSNKEVLTEIENELQERNSKFSLTTRLLSPKP